MPAQGTAALLANFLLAAGQMGASGGPVVGSPGEVKSLSLRAGEIEVAQPKGGAATVSQPQQGAFEVKT